MISWTRGMMASTNDGIRRETGPRLLFSQLKVLTLSCFSPSLCVRHSLRCLHDSTRPHQLCWTFHRLVDSFKLATTCAAVYNVTFNREGGGVCRDENPPRCAYQHTSSYPAVKYRSEDKHLDGKHIWRREKEERGRLRLLATRARATFWNHQLPGTRKGMASPISLCIWINRQSQSGAGYGASREKEPKLSKKSPEREAKGNGNKRKKKKRKKKVSVDPVRSADPFSKKTSEKLHRRGERKTTPFWLCVCVISASCRRRRRRDDGKATEEEEASTTRVLSVVRRSLHPRRHQPTAKRKGGKYLSLS